MNNAVATSKGGKPVWGGKVSKRSWKVVGTSERTERSVPGRVSAKFASSSTHDGNVYT